MTELPKHEGLPPTPLTPAGIREVVLAKQSIQPGVEVATTETPAETSSEVTSEDTAEVTPTVDAGGEAQIENAPLLESSVEQTPAKEDLFARGKEIRQNIEKNISGFFSNTASKIGKLFKGAGAFGVRSIDAALSVPDLLRKGKEKVTNWASTKVEQLKDFASSKVELMKNKATYASNKTVEGFQNVREGIVDRYNKVVEYGENSVASARERVAGVTNSFREAKNNIAVDRLLEKLTKIKNEQSAVASRAEVLQNQNDRVQGQIRALVELINMARA